MPSELPIGKSVPCSAVLVGRQVDSRVMQGVQGTIKIDNQSIPVQNLNVSVASRSRARGRSEASAQHSMNLERGVGMGIINTTERVNLG
jgi:hypothetical protein